MLAISLLLAAAATAAVTPDSDNHDGFPLMLSPFR